MPPKYWKALKTKCVTFFKIHTWFLKQNMSMSFGGFLLRIVVKLLHVS